MLKTKKKMVLLVFHIFLFCYLGLAEAGQEESIKPINLYTISSSELRSGLAISVTDRELGQVSSSASLVETWLRRSVLSLYPSRKRKLAALDFPARPNPSPETSEPSPVHSSVGFSVPSSIAKHPQSPQPQIASPPESGGIGFSPEIGSPHGDGVISLSPEIASPPENDITALSPEIASPPENDVTALPPQIASPPENDVTALPPLIASPPDNDVTALPPQTASPPENGFTDLSPQTPPLFEPTSPPPSFQGRPAVSPVAPASPHGLWCVAKPSVPAETLQAAMDYACGEGAAECGEISAGGRCFEPDTVVGHASYAFNSYWQKHKRNGGTCSFGGTAMLINKDPSFLQCRFILT